jgi:hypothetical protein
MGHYSPGHLVEIVRSIPAEVGSANHLCFEPATIITAIAGLVTVRVEMVRGQQMLSTVDGGVGC